MQAAHHQLKEKTMVPDNRLPLVEIAARISEHLRRIELAQPDHGSVTCPYWNAAAWKSGGWVGVMYVSYQHTSSLRRAEALRYLAWLDAGNEGHHQKALAETTSG
jgi:hypothetical protein